MPKKIVWNQPRLSPEDDKKATDLFSAHETWAKEVAEFRESAQEKYCLGCPHNTDDGMECVFYDSPCLLAKLLDLELD